MKSQFQKEAEFIADYYLFNFTPVRAECEFCKSDFTPKYYKPTRHTPYGRWQRFCSGICWKLWKQEQSEYD